MLTILCLFLFFLVFGSIIKLALKMAWGVTKVILGIVVLPILVLALIFSGIFLFAFPILFIAGIVVLGKLLVKI